jgi:rRNA-processing protein FCF1
MNEYSSILFEKYRTKGVIVDTNVLLLYLVGSFDPNLIRNFKRTAGFTEEDFDLVNSFTNSFEMRVTTPHILTEVSDLIGNREELHILLKEYLNFSDEKFLESKKIAENPAFNRFGLADTAIVDTAKDSYLVFTDDGPLYNFLTNIGVDALKLDQIRPI